MIIMALLFIIQMSVSIGAIAVSHEQQSKLMEAGWRRMSDNMKSKIQDLKDCCGFKNRTLTPSDPKMGHPNCDLVSRKSSSFFFILMALMLGVSNGKFETLSDIETKYLFS